MNLFSKPLAFVAKHPWWTLALAFVLLLLPTLALIVAGFLEVFRGWAVKILGDAGAKLADWTEELLNKSLWIVSLALFFVPPLWPLAFVMGLWSVVDWASNKGGKRADFSATWRRADAAGKAPGVGDDLFNSEPDESDTDLLKLFNKGNPGAPARDSVQTSGISDDLLFRTN